MFNVPSEDNHSQSAFVKEEDETTCSQSRLDLQTSSMSSSS